MENDYSKLVSLEALKEFCNSNLFDIAAGVSWPDSHSIKVRFIDQDGKFGVTGLGRFFFIYDCMYIITNNPKYETDHNPDILDFSKELEILKYSNHFIVRVIFAGIFTGFYDDEGEQVFTGDVVEARVIMHPMFPSSGGANRAKSSSDIQGGFFCQAGVEEMLGQYSLIFDNHCAPLSWATKLKVIGSVFFDLERGQTEVDIRGLCSALAQSRDRNELLKLVRKSPYFPPVTWQEKALELLYGTDEEENGE